MIHQIKKSYDQWKFENCDVHECKAWRKEGERVANVLR